MRWSDRVWFRALILRFSLAVSLGLAAALAVVSTAQAQDADDLIHKGIELRKQGRDQDALETFRRANALSSTPRALAQLGFAEQALGRWVDAYEHVDAALRGTGDAWIVKNRPVLESSLATIRKHVGEVEILGEPKGAEVRVDGRPQGTLPLPARARAAAGTISVEVRAAGYLPVTRAVVVAPEELVRETIILQPLAPTAVLTGAPSAEPSQPVGTDNGHPPAGEAPRPWIRRLAWGGAAGAGLFAVAGGVALVVRESKAQWFSDSTHACDENVPGKGGAGCRDAYDSGHTAGSLAVGSFIAAGVLGIGAAILFYNSAPAGDAARGSTMGFACAPAGSGFGLTCATRF